MPVPRARAEAVGREALRAGRKAVAEALEPTVVAKTETVRLDPPEEAATVVAATEHLHDGQTSVGTHVELRHRRATAVGRKVRVDALDASGRRLASAQRRVAQLRAGKRGVNRGRGIGT